MGGLGDYERSPEPPSQEDHGSPFIAGPRAGMVDSRSDVVDLLPRNEPPALAVAEAEAAVVERKARVSPRDQCASEARRLKCLQAEIPGARDYHDRRVTRAGKPELAVQPVA